MYRSVSARTAASVVASGVPVGNWTCTKISPRSTAGKNSKPMAPSGISAIAPIVRTTEMATTFHGLRSDHDSG